MEGTEMPEDIRQTAADLAHDLADEDHVELATGAIAEAILAERERCAKAAENRDVIGYVPDSGCYRCFDRIAAEIRKGA